ncbi:UNVERIFIED_CONTAM: spore germination protein GerM [Paenibacillus sp. PvR008]
MNKKLYFLFILSLLMVLMIIGVGCDEKPSSNSDKVQSSGNNKKITDSQGTEQTQVIKVFFADSQVERLEEDKVEVTFTDASDKYQQAFKSLQNNTKPDLVSLWNKIKLKSVSFNAGMVTLDVQIPDAARLGSGGEQLALDALKNTLFQFDEVNSIELLVDGKALESLMGHADLEHPILRENP